MFKVIYIHNDVVAHFGWFATIQEAKAKIKSLKAGGKKDKGIFKIEYLTK